MLKLTCTTQLIAIVCALGFLASCPNDRQLHGTGEVARKVEEVNQCWTDCDCKQFDYNPVCLGGSEQYLNPCWAGCTGLNATSGLYENCTCASAHPEEADEAEDTFLGFPGLCPSTCSYLPVFLTSFFFTMLVTFMANMPTLTATLRCVDPEVRSLALGLQWLIIRLLGKTIDG